jgi:hypothetical protein
LPPVRHASADAGMGRAGCEGCRDAGHPSGISKKFYSAEVPRITAHCACLPSAMPRSILTFGRLARRLATEPPNHVRAPYTTG